MPNRLELLYKERITTLNFKNRINLKHIFLGILVTLSVSFAKAQSTELTYKVTNYEIDGENYDNLAINRDVALSFYMCDDNTLCFTNQWRNNNSQSYGGVYSLKKREIAETKTTYAATEFKFTWKFFNTYDSKSGDAAVTITNIYIGNTVKFTAEIVVLETNSVLVLKGYLE